jgi:Bifunctional DNA primase/polymerase, N-terminal/AAA domain/Primase C terminal 1 (PriCT-1)
VSGDAQNRAALFAEHARRYAELGWALTPLNGKVPRSRKWQTESPLEPNNAAGKWAHYGRQGDNMGVVLGGSQPPLAVVEPDTYEAHERLESLFGGRLPMVPTAKTGNRSQHLYFLDGGQGNAAIGGLELRAGGQQCALPPSVHPETGRPYTWVDGREPWTLELGPLPDVLLEHFFGAERRKGRAGPVAAELGEGDRHKALMSLAGTMRRRSMSGAAILAALRVENEQRCRPPLPDRELEHIADVAQGYEPADEPLEDVEPRPMLRTRGVILERVRPIRWLWARRVPMGLPSLIVGMEGVGKGTLTAWLIARATRGELDGDLHGEPIRVLIVGDEDSFEPVWVPRLAAADADLAMLRTLDDGEYVDDFRAVADELEATIVADEIGLVLLDALLDHIPAGTAGEAIYNPKNVRQALQPLRRIAAVTDVAALGLLHPIKGPASTFRQLVAGSHQFNAVSRSSLLLGVDPDDEERRLLVRGKGNHSAAPRSFEFTLAAEVVELNKHSFEVPKVVEPMEGDRTIDDLLKPPAAPIRDELAAMLEPLLTDEPKKRADLARAVRRDPKDGSVGNALEWLESRGIAERTPKGWKRR